MGVNSVDANTLWCKTSSYLQALQGDLNNGCKEDYTLSDAQDKL